MFLAPAACGEAAGNKPNASTAYDLSGTGLAGHRNIASPSEVVDGVELKIYAFATDADGNPSGAWEIADCTYNDLATDTLTRGTLEASSTGSKIDWSATGEDETPTLLVVSPSKGRRVHSQGTVVDDAYITIGGSTGKFRADKDYVVSLHNIVPASESDMYAQLYDDTAGAWHTSGNYHSSADGHYDGSVNTGGVGGATQFQLHSANLAVGNNQTSGAEEGFYGRYLLSSPEDENAATPLSGHSTMHWTGGQQVAHRFVGALEYHRSVTGVRFYMSSGNLTSGSYICWEIDR